MLTSEDRDVLGLPKESVRTRRPSAVSQVLKAINADFNRGIIDWNVSGEDDDAGFQIRVASDRASRRRAYALAHRVYSGRGYVSDEQQLILSRYDTHNSTLTLLAQDEKGGDAATISLNFDSAEGLPCDEIYSEELNGLRGQGLGPERACLRVQGAPAVLLRCDLGMGEREIRRVGGQGANSSERTLYPYFYSWMEEGAVAEFLAKSHTPMSAEDARFFGLTEYSAS